MFIGVGILKYICFYINFYIIIGREWSRWTRIWLKNVRRKVGEISSNNSNHLYCLS